MASRTETLKLIISGDGRSLSTELGKTETQVRQWGTRVKGVFTGIGKRIAASVKSIVTNPLAIVGGTAGIMFAGKQLMDYDSKLTRLGITAEISAEEVLKLREELGNIAIATGQSRTSLLAGLDQFVEQTGDLEYARGIMRDLGVASTATGAEVEHLAALTVQLRDKFKLTKDEVGRAMNLLTVQGKSGAFTLQNMAEYGERLFAAASRFDMSGMKQLGAFGAMMQIARMGTGSSAQATTSIEGVFADILDKQKEIRKLGFNIFKSPGQLKSYEEIVKGIIIATKGSETKLGEIFGRQSIRGISVLAKMYRDTNGFDLFDKLAGADADKADVLMQDFLRYATSLDFQMKQLSNIGWDFMEAALVPVLGEFNKQLKELTSNPEKMAAFREEIKKFGETASNVAYAVGPFVRILENVGTILRTIPDFVELQQVKNQNAIRQREMIGLGGNEFDALPLPERWRRIDEYNKNPEKYLREYYAGKLAEKQSQQLRSALKNLPPDVAGRYYASKEFGPVSLDQKITINAPEGTRVLTENRGSNVSANTKTSVNRGAF